MPKSVKTTTIRAKTLSSNNYMFNRIQSVPDGFVRCMALTETSFGGSTKQFVL